MTAHGEYKEPGGKLVVVDLEVAGGRLSRVEVTGDFFLEPPEALDAIVSALEGCLVSATVEQLSAQIASALPPDTTMLGFDTTSVAIAVRRALDADTPRERL